MNSLLTLATLGDRLDNIRPTNSRLFNLLRHTEQEGRRWQKSRHDK